MYNLLIKVNILLTFPVNMAWLERTAASSYLKVYFWPLCSPVPGGRAHRRPHIDCGFCRWGAGEGLHHWYLWDQKSMLTYWIYPPWLMMFSWTRRSISAGGTFKIVKREKQLGENIGATRRCYVFKSQRCLNGLTPLTSQRFGIK